MRQIEKKVFEILEGQLAKMDYELVGCEYIAQGRYSVLRLFVDKDGGISLDDIQAVMSFVNPILDVEDIIQGQYNLEVSSPGENRPLFTLEHYKKFMGRNAQIKMAVPLNGRRNFKGSISQVNDSSVELKLDDSSVDLNFENIEKANLLAEKK